MCSFSWCISEKMVLNNFFCIGDYFIPDYVVSVYEVVLLLYALCCCTRSATNYLYFYLL